MMIFASRDNFISRVASLNRKVTSHHIFERKNVARKFQSVREN